jgi:putative endopeptidase
MLFKNPNIMKNLFYLFVMVFFITAATSCGGGKSGLGAGIRTSNMDTTMSPGTDFYRYATGGWQDANPLPAEYSRYGQFDELAQNTLKQLDVLIAGIAAQQHQAGTIPYKIATVYNQAMDSTKRNADGIDPIRAQLAQIAALKTNDDVKAYMAATRPEGFSPYFNMYVGADEKNSSMNILNILQGGLGMGDRDYYLEQDENTAQIRAKYVEHIARMFSLAGFAADVAAAKAASILATETRLARALYSREQLRDPQANYHKTTIAELQRDYPGLEWAAYFAAAGYPAMSEVVVAQSEPLKEAAVMIDELPVADHIAYLEWELLNHAAGSLNDALEEQNFDFYGRTLSGSEQQQPRWKRAVAAVNGFLGEAVGQMYVEKHFPPASKERMLGLVANLQAALGARIENLEWMSPDTKAKAQEKLAAFVVKIGYPDKWKDYGPLDIQTDSYWANVLRANRFYHAENAAKAGKPVDRTEWFMTPQTVNAYYNPTTNEICFPAGILQYPFFDMEADDAFNYGAIGMVIAHEMTHGFDDQGRQYDKEGNMNDWWTAEDTEKFNARADKLVAYFDKIEVLPGLNANGRFTLGENIADQGGVQLAWDAYKNATADTPPADKDGLTAGQRFFLAYAGVWAANIRDEEIRRRTRTDPHSLGKWRVDGTVPHIAAWYDAFGITPADPMYVAPEERAIIW